MSIFRLSATALLLLSSISLIGCLQSVVKTTGSANQDVVPSQSEIDLMIHKAKVTERARVQTEYERQALRANVFANLKKMNLPALAGNCLVDVMVPSQRLSSDTNVLISEQRVSSRTVICEEHLTVKNIVKLQARLHDQGYLTSAEVDRKDLLNGQWDERTQLAMLTYQKENGLAYGLEGVEWTLESLKHLDLL